MYSITKKYYKWREELLFEDNQKNAMLSLKNDYKGSKLHKAIGDGSAVRSQQTKKTWDDGAPMTNKFGPKQSGRVPKGKFLVLDTKKFWYYEIKGTWHAIDKKEYGTPPGFEY